MKRVYALYRVSTKKQVDVNVDDIPMQENACRDFAERQGWMIEKEFKEKGISGFKVSAEKRDAIQDLKEAATNHEFDILLVFMFDRLGRIESETPFVLQWFAENGVEVWSVKEGQQKFESHVDNLTNYIRFWQAAGESKKTSVRVKTRLEQMTAEGIYTGGKVPFGYTLIYKGRKNKKGQDMKDLDLDPTESVEVQKIFSMFTEEGYGSYQIAEYLNRKGLQTHGGTNFQSINVLRILKSPIYCGYLKNGNAKSERIGAFQIIDDATFEKAQMILSQRAQKDDEKRTIAMTNKGKALLSGNVFCAHCGCHLATTSYKSAGTKVNENGIREEQIRYLCYHRSRGLNDCNGAGTYNAKKVDAEILELMRSMFARISGCPEEEKIASAYKKTMEANHKRQQQLDSSLKKKQKQLEALRNEISKSLIGESMFNSEDLHASLETLRKTIAEESEELKKLQEEDSVKKEASDSIVPAYRQFRSWADEFEAASWEKKKMIACQLFSRIEIGKGYKIHVVINMTYQQFLSEWSDDRSDFIA